EDGRASEAESLARQAADGLAGPGSLDEEPFALGVLARSLLAQNKLSEAQQAMDKARNLASRGQDVQIQMDVAINAGCVRVADGKTAESIASLRSVIDRAMKLGSVSYALQARLALGEVEVKAGKRIAGRATLVEIQRDAKTRGFTLIARQAAKAAV